MEKCLDFRKEVKQIASKELGIGRRPAETNKIIRIWCTHEESPLTEEESYTVGSRSRLGCDGDLEKCPIKDLL